MTESQMTRRLCKRLTDKGWFVYAAVGTEMQSGWPDRFIAHAQWHGWVEFKTDDYTCEPQQKLTIKRLLERGVNVHVVRFLKPESRLQLEDREGVIFYEFHESKFLEVMIGTHV